VLLIRQTCVEGRPVVGRLLKIFPSVVLDSRVMFTKMFLMLIGTVGGAVVGLGLGVLLTWGCAEAFAALMPNDPSAWGAGSLLGLFLVPGGIVWGAIAGAMRGYWYEQGGD
jgi:hypothetical protein